MEKAINEDILYKSKTLFIHYWYNHQPICVIAPGVTLLIRLMFYMAKHLTHNWLKTHGCVISTETTDALVLKHQAISSHSADEISIVSDQFHTEILHLLWKT